MDDSVAFAFNWRLSDWHFGFADAYDLDGRRVGDCFGIGPISICYNYYGN